MGELKEIVRDSLEEFVVHFRVMLKKNWLVSKRSYKTIIAQLIAPILFILLLFGLNNIGNSEERDPPTETFQNFPICKADDTSEKKCISLMYVYNGRDTSSFPNSTAFMDMNDADSIMNLISSKYNIPVVGYTSGSDIDSNSIYKFSSRTELDQYIIDHPNTTQSAIVFEPNDTSIAMGSAGPTYTILINGTNPDLESAQFVQTAVDQSILTHFGRKLGIIPTSVTPEYKVATRKWPVIDVAGYDAVASYGGLFFYCAIMFNFTIFLYQIVNEKQLELRKGMRMIGLSDVAYWLSWEVTNLIFIVVYCLIIIFFGYITGLAFFLRTHFLVLFFTFFLFGFAMTQLAVLLGMFITTTKQAINVGMLIFVVGTVAQIIFSVNFIFQILYWPEQASPAYRIILQFYPPFNFSKLINDISTKANAEAVRALDPSDKSLLFRWSDLYEERNMIQFSIPQAADSMWLLVMNILLFSALAWFFYNVLPSEKSGPFYFIFTRDYWARLFPKRNYSTPNVQPDPKDDSDVQEEVKQAVSNTSAELRVLGLHKKFTKLFSCGRGIYAVRGMNLSVGSGQVFALLGHNGAGKTTTLSILTGIIKATKGDAIIFGKSLKHELTEVQRIIGVCPQHNILWDELTAREHLEIFSEIRRVPKAEREAEIVARLKDVLLLEAQNKKSGEYSGGMKRRLMVAVSAIGNPKVIFLDEPTTGLDPMSRREIWSAVQQLKKDRIIILTTHSMEEADFLGDRIGIMARGRLKCIGTSLHLKNKFGLGYRLNITTRPEKQESFKMEFARLVPNAELIAETVGGNLVYGVQTAQLDKLVPFFQNIEGDNALGVKDWGISQTTLEEVFLKVTHESEGVDVTIMK